ncbi:MAG: SGNH/GDSL hydrolase family protein [Actinomycetota bacterium]|nr:SGNH/GDSL hydrolase family protein [Actinomycetota bacterium]
MRQTSGTWLGGVLASILIAAFSGAGAASASAEDQPAPREALVPYGADGYRYKIVEHGEGDGFEAVNYDDSTFSVGAAPFGSSGYCGLSYETEWRPDSDLLVRKTIEVSAGTGELEVSLAIDNDAEAFWNGEALVGDASHEGCAERGSVRFSVPESIINDGNNLLAVRGIDRGDQTHLDITVSPASLKYIALGDSIAAGEGGIDMSLYEDPCLRNMNAYPRVFATSVGTTVKHIACSGARLPHLGAGLSGRFRDKRQTKGDVTLPFQFEEIPEATDFITVTIGANDVRWSKVIASCAGVWPPHNGTCTDDWPNLDKDIRGLRQPLKEMLVKLDKRTGEAKILFVGYPHFFPRVKDTSWKDRNMRCGKFVGELPWLRDRFTNAKETMLGAVRDAKKSGAGDVYWLPGILHAFKGHERCEKDSWVNGATKQRGKATPGPGSFHPKAAGYESIATLISDWWAKHGDAR